MAETEYMWIIHPDGLNDEMKCVECGDPADCVPHR